MRTTGFLAPAAAREASWLSRWEAGRGPDGGSGRGEPQVRLSSSELCGGRRRGRSRRFPGHSGSLTAPGCGFEVIRFGLTPAAAGTS